MTVRSSRVARSPALKGPEPGLDPVGQILGQGTKGGAGQVPAFLEEGPDQTGHEEGTALGPSDQPVDEGVGNRRSDKLLGQLSHVPPGEMGHGKPGEQTFLLQRPTTSPATGCSASSSGRAASRMSSRKSARLRLR